MELIQGYYNNIYTNITFEEDKIKAGTKTIPFKKIYDIHEDYLTNYTAIMGLAIIVFGACLFGLFALFFFKIVSTLFIVTGGFIGAFFSFFIYPKLLRKKYQEEYIKFVDIIYQESHETIIVRGNFDITKYQAKMTKKTLMQKRVLNKYLSRLRKSRKYLVQQIEQHEKLNVNELLEKYGTVAQVRYSMKTILSTKQIEILKNTFQIKMGNISKLGYLIAKICIVIVFAAVVYLLLNKEISYNSFL